MALRDARARGASTQCATAWVTLEPCSHHGRTGPCCEALIAAGISRVVASIADPNPLVSGQGFARLRAAGIEVEVGPGADESRELNIGFFSRMMRHVPWVRMKMAASLDGRTALDNGVSQWITSEPARADGHAWRARACAVLTGIGTVLDDDPRLDVRLVGHVPPAASGRGGQPARNTADARLFDAAAPVFIYAAVDIAPKARAALEARGRHRDPVASGPGSTGMAKVDLAALLRDLARRDINELHVEAGPS
jgi:diaminohydroxyphosphoribosylaminopyrimidine deaminase/5-amino-6-(5-phosphoribosylamino)uracil reductase